MERIAGYEPAEAIPMRPPTLRGGPLRALRTVRDVVWMTMWPYGFVYAGLAALVWNVFTPSMDRMQRFAVGWIAEIYLRNVVLLLVSAGGLHLWLYVRRAQGKKYKYDDRWLSNRSRRFLWGSQTRDNMFWALASGAALWTAYEALLLWSLRQRSHPEDRLGRRAGMGRVPAGDDGGAVLPGDGLVLRDPPALLRTPARCTAGPTSCTTRT